MVLNYIYASDYYSSCNSGFLAIFEDSRVHEAQKHFCPVEVQYDLHEEFPLKAIATLEPIRKNAESLPIVLTLTILVSFEVGKPFFLPVLYFVLLYLQVFGDVPYCISDYLIYTLNFCYIPFYKASFFLSNRASSCFFSNIVDLTISPFRFFAKQRLV